MISLPTDLNGNVLPIARLLTTSAQKLDGSSTAATSTAISATEKSVVLLAAEDPIHFLIGTNPTADANDMLLPGGMIWLILDPGEKISIFGGVGYISPAG